MLIDGAATKKTKEKLLALICCNTIPMGKEHAPYNLLLLRLFEELRKKSMDLIYFKGNPQSRVMKDGHNNRGVLELERVG